MKSVLNVWKPVGMTPLQAVQKFKEKNSEYLYAKMSYAGRLDPMAEGILILLVGEENKKRERYLKLKKTYKSEIILGVSTDSFDGLGIINSINHVSIEKTKIEKALKEFKGKQNQTYPPFSSKTINGKSLYWWVKNEKLKEIELPKRQIEIYSIALISVEKIQVDKLVNILIANIKKVEGDFRQDKVIKGWEEFKKENKNSNLTKVKFETTCSTGTYIRRIASDFGEKLGCGAFAFSIKRTSLGKIMEKDCIDIK